MKLKYGGNVPSLVCLSQTDEALSRCFFHTLINVILIYDILQFKKRNTNKN